MNIWDLRELEKCKEKKVAVVALRKLKDPAAIPALKEVLEGKFIERVRNTCLWKEAKAAISELEASEG
jgi:HEAT repeat protein